MCVARKAQAARFAANVLLIIRDIQAAGFTSLNAIAGQLNARKVATANGGQWRHTQVEQILDRASADEGRLPGIGRSPASSRKHCGERLPRLTLVRQPQYANYSRCRKSRPAEVSTAPSQHQSSIAAARCRQQLRSGGDLPQYFVGPQEGSEQ
jgi:hypothetical protein